VKETLVQLLAELSQEETPHPSETDVDKGAWKKR